MSSPAFSVRELPWIRVRYDDGVVRSVGLDRALEDAHRISDLADSNPLSSFATLRFLISTATLVVRRDEEAVSARTFTSGAVASALDDIDAHLWLVHDTSPFMQDLGVDIESSSNSVRTLFGRTAGESAKAWFDRDLIMGDAPTAEQTVLALVTAWFAGIPAATSSRGRYLDDEAGVKRPGRGAITPRTCGVRAFWSGQTLAETLLANIDPAWRALGNPAWIIPVGRDLSPHQDAFTAATWSGTIFRLAPPEDGRFSRVRGIGRRTEVDAMWGGTGSLDKAYKVNESDLWRADPSIIRRAFDRKRPDELAPVRPLPAGTAGLEYVRQWLSRRTMGGQETSPIQPRARGLIRAYRTRLFVIEVTGLMAFELVNAGWFRLSTDVVADETVRRQMEDLSSSVLSPMRDALYAASLEVYGKDKSGRRAANAKVNAMMLPLTGSIESALEDLLPADGEEDFTTAEVRTITRLASEAFARETSPMRSGSSAPRIAQARATLRSALSRIEGQFA